MRRSGVTTEAAPMWHTAWFKPLGILLGISFFFLESFGSARWQAYHPGLFADTKVVENNTDGVRSEAATERSKQH